MKFNFYIATASQNGLEMGKHYFVGKDKKVVLQDGKREFFSCLKNFLKPITSYEGELKEMWQQGKKEMRMGVSDFFDYAEMQVKLIEVYQKKKSLVCLAQLPGNEEYVQIDVPNMRVF